MRRETARWALLEHARHKITCASQKRGDFLSAWDDRRSPAECQETAPFFLAPKRKSGRAQDLSGVSDLAGGKEIRAMAGAISRGMQFLRMDADNVAERTADIRDEEEGNRDDDAEDVHQSASFLATSAKRSARHGGERQSTAYCEFSVSTLDAAPATGIEF